MVLVPVHIHVEADAVVRVCPDFLRECDCDVRDRLLRHPLHGGPFEIVEYRKFERTCAQELEEPLRAGFCLRHRLIIAKCINTDLQSCCACILIVSFELLVDALLRDRTEDCVFNACCRYLSPINDALVL